MVASRMLPEGRADGEIAELGFLPQVSCSASRPFHREQALVGKPMRHSGKAVARWRNLHSIVLKHIITMRS
jgi:hypothetical protein